jgi:hypothetical protein
MPLNQTYLMFGRALNRALTDRLLTIMEQRGYANKYICSATGLDRGVWYKVAIRQRLLLQEEQVALCVAFGINYGLLLRKTADDIAQRGNWSFGSALGEALGPEIGGEVDPKLGGDGRGEGRHGNAGLPA